MLGVPLIAGGALLGVIHVGSFHPRPFDELDTMLLEVAADKIAGALQTAMAISERVAAGVLQRSLLPSALPRHPQIEFASRYAPAERGDVGGDWYDAFQLRSGDVWVMAGDVTGHGLNPAIIMGRLRSAMRAYALLGMSPEDVLRGANRKLQFFEAGAMATVVCGVLSPPFREFRVCSAGHLPPIIAHRGEDARLLSVAQTPPLGVLAEIDPLALRCPVQDGTTIVLYTDGLVERRGELITDGIERLRAVVRCERPERLCGEVMDALIGHYVPDDDVALLALQAEIRGGRAGATARCQRCQCVGCSFRSVPLPSRLSQGCPSFRRWMCRAAGAPPPSRRATYGLGIGDQCRLALRRAFRRHRRTTG